MADKTNLMRSNDFSEIHKEGVGIIKRYTEFLYKYFYIAITTKHQYKGWQLLFLKLCPNISFAAWYWGYNSRKDAV